MPPTNNSQYLTINDFRPGIVLNVRQPTTPYLDLPPGTAAPGTYGCYALATGALTPAPGHVAALDQTFTMSAHMDAASLMRPVGIFTCGPLAQEPGIPPWWSQNANFSDELHFMVEGKAAAGTHHSLEWHVRKLYRTPIPADNIVTKDGIDQLGLPDVHGVTGITARLLNASFGDPGLPTFVTEWSESPLVTGGSKFVMFYPDPANTASDTVASNSLGPCQLLNFSGRVLRLDWRFYNHGANNGAYYTNEQIEYTDPPNSNTWTGNQATVLDADNPNGYMSWGSLVYGEVIFFRQSGGALVIDGDIYAPQVTILKGVRSVGNLMNVASPSDTGLIYCVDNDGAYMWEGGNTSRKISTIADRFYDRDAGNPTTGVKVKHVRWGQFVIFPNGWMFDILTEAWWRLVTPAAETTISLMDVGKGSPHLLFCAEDAFTTPATTTVSVYDYTKQTNIYEWNSQPIKVSEGNRIDITEVVVSTVSIPAGGATIGVYILDGTGSRSVFPPNAIFTFAANSGEPIRLRIPVGVTNAPHIRVKVIVQATVATQIAPTLLSLSFGWQPSTPYTQT